MTKLIDLHDVSRIFDRSIDTMRKYRRLGLIEPCKIVGQKDLYNKKDINNRKYLIRGYKREGKTLQEIANIIQGLREELDIVKDEKTKKVLIIEDDKGMVQLMRSLFLDYFSGENLKIYYAHEGPIGMEYAIGFKPDLIILDLGLPDLSGIQIYEELSNDPRLSRSKFIILSGQIEYRPRLDVPFLSKPFRIHELIKTVGNLIGLHSTAEAKKATDTIEQFDTQKSAPKVFLSYARENFHDAQKLYNDLCDLNLEVWFDKENLLPGQKWKAAIKRAINESRFFLALLSTKSIDKKGYVQKEMKEALNILGEYPVEAIFVIPVRLDKCIVEDQRIRDLTWVDMFPDWEDGLKRIIKAITSQF